MTVNSHCFPEQLYPGCRCVFCDVGLNFWCLRLDEFRSLTFKKEECADRQLQSVHCHKEGADRQMQSVHFHKEGAEWQMHSVDCHKEGADRQLKSVHCHKEGADRQMQSVHCHKDGSAIFAVLRAVLANSRVFWDMTTCRWLR